MKGFYREISVSGLNLERLLQQATDNQVQMTRIRRNGGTLTLWVMEEHTPALLSLAEKGGWLIKTGRRRGAGRGLDALVSRWLLSACFALGLCLVIASLQLVWGIEITGAGVYQADVTAYLDMWPVRPLTWKNQIDLGSLQDALEWRYPDVAWVECGWRGPVLSIALNQGVPLGDSVDYRGSGDVVASRDGVIDSVVTIAGTALVKPGDVVHKGQTLILGEERTAADETRIVMARGVIKARVWEGITLRIPAVEMQTNYTGNYLTVWNVICPWFKLLREKTPDYDAADIERSQMQVGGLFFPFILQQQTIREVLIEEKGRNRAELEAEASSAALRLLQKKTGNCDDFVDKWVDCCMIEDEVLEAVAVGERVIDIAQARRSDH